MRRVTQGMVEHATSVTLNHSILPRPTERTRTSFACGLACNFASSLTQKVADWISPVFCGVPWLPKKSFLPRLSIIVLPIRRMPSFQHSRKVSGCAVLSFYTKRQLPKAEGCLLYNFCIPESLWYARLFQYSLLVPLWENTTTYDTHSARFAHSFLGKTNTKHTTHVCSNSTVHQVHAAPLFFNLGS